MITKNDCLSILVRLEDEGININPYMKKLLVSKEVPLEVLRFISQNRGIEVSNFYEMLRKKHNKNKSPLYTNILKEISEPEEVVTTLSCMLTQIILYGQKLTNPDTFYKEVRAEEISRALNEYFKEEALENCIKLISLIKSDILVLEYISGRRELEN